MRPLCICGQRPAAINYKKTIKHTIVRLCERCLRNGIITEFLSGSKRGYEKKGYLRKVQFTSKHEEQFNVFHIDGNLTNCRSTNLKTICANCQRIIQKEGLSGSREI